MGRVEGKVALVTGAASGLGAADAALLAREGAKVILTDVDAALGHSVAAGIPGAVFVEHDVRDERAWKTIVDQIMADHGRLDVLVNNAGVVKFASIEDCSLDDFRFVNSVMSEGTFLGCRTALPAMLANGGGSISRSKASAALDAPLFVGASNAGLNRVAGPTVQAASSPCARTTSP